MKARFLLITIAIIMLTACNTASSSDFDIASKVQQENLPVLVSTLPTKRDYIIYVKQMNVKSNEVWAISPTSGEKVQVANGDGLFPENWSPSGNHWLFVDYYSLYVANADGSGIRRIYQVNDKSYISAWWLSEEIILFEVYAYDENGKLWPPPHQYYLNIQNGETGRLDPKKEDDSGGTYLMQGIIPSNESWIQVNGFSDDVEIADLQGNHIRILSDHKLLYSVGLFGMESVPKTNKVIFLAGKKDKDDPNKALNGLWEMSLSDKQPKLIAEDAPDLQFYEYHVSPDAKYLAYTYSKGLNIFVTVLNLKDYKLEYKWDFPYHLSTPSFHWSPDSRYIVLPYTTSDQTTLFGVQIMNISSGATNVLLDEDVVINNWYYVNPQ